MRQRTDSPGRLGRWWRMVFLLMGQEISANRRLWWASLGVGGLPFLAPWLPSLSHHPALQVREGMALGLGGFFGVVLVLFLGSGFLARDLAEGRSGFYFARPLPGGALAFGKLLGAWVLALACQVVMLLGLWIEPLLQGRLLRARALGEIQPLFMWADQYTPMTSYEGLPTPLPGASMPVLWALAVLAILLIVHALTLWMRARSLWLLLDMTAMALLGALGHGVIERLQKVQAFGSLVWLVRCGFAVLLLALLVALWAQVHWGRTHLQRSHRAFSLALWSVLGLAAVAADGYSRHVVSPELEDVAQIRFTAASPASPWLMLGGVTRHRGGFPAAFLLQTDEGRSHYLGGLDVTASWFTFSQDGRRAAWLSCQRLSRPMGCEVWDLDLQDDRAAPRATGLRMDVFPDDLALSSNGRRLAMVRRRDVEVYDLATMRLIGSKRLGTEIEAVSFESEGRLRLRSFDVPEGTDTELGRRLLRMDVESGEVEVAGYVQGSVVRSWTLRRGGIDLSLYQMLFPPRLALLDGSDGATRWALPPDPPAEAQFLADGRLLLARHEAAGGHWELRVMASDGEILHREERLGVQDVVLGGEWRKDHLWVALKEDAAASAPAASSSLATPLGGLAVSAMEGWTLYSLDATSYELRAVAGGLRPLWNPQGAFYTPQVGSPATFLFTAGGGAIVSWQPESGDGRRVFPPPLRDSIR